MAITHTAHKLIKEHFSNLPELEKHIAIDATCGNGHDTKFICELGFQNVYAFDIQEEALEQTRLITQHYNNVHLIADGHETMQDHIQEKVQLIMFNLGYLPNGNKHITTLENTTVVALSQALNLLDENGLLSVICYPGHETGKAETIKVKEFMTSLSLNIQEHLSDYPSPKAPIFYLLEKNHNV